MAQLLLLSVIATIVIASSRTEPDDDVDDVMPFAALDAVERKRLSSLITYICCSCFLLKLH